ncbi:hypothetical protein M514_09686 [Trichuris suis]|uniref:G-protein coupled receptors family 1 profile domain-containing protein n=1 Tax=Trichuris suis TaxID=68888 RepID=A0A085N2D9_9BILA|nr:hypothetical protein M514_09686 [Trichuris suis]
MLTANMSRQKAPIYEHGCSLQLDNVSDDRFLQDWLTMEAKFFAFILPVITGILVNVLILTIILCCRTFHFKQHLFLCNMAFADLLLAAVCGIINMHKEGLTNFSYGTRTSSMCAVMAFAELSAQTVMVFGQASASFERFLVIVMPFQAQRLWTRETSGAIILICWLAAFTVGTLGPILVEHQCIEFTDTRGGNHIWHYCSVRAGYYLTLSKVRLIFLFSIPFALMMVFYGTICWRLWRTCTRFSVARFSPLSYHSSIESKRSIAERLLSPLHRMSNSSNRFGDVGVIESRRRVIKMLIMVLLVFFVCWSPKLLLDVKNAEYIDSCCTTDVDEWSIDLESARLFAEVLVLYYPTISALLFFLTASRIRENCKFLKACFAIEASKLRNWRPRQLTPFFPGPQLGALQFSTNYRRAMGVLKLHLLLLLLLQLVFLARSNVDQTTKATDRRVRGPIKNVLPFANVAEHSLLNQGSDQEDGVRIVKASHFSQSCRLGGKLNILCSAVGQPRPTITWYKDGAELVLKNNIHLQEIHESDSRQTSRIEIDPATLGDQGIYTCVAHNENDSVVKNFKSEVNY